MDRGALSTFGVIFRDEPDWDNDTPFQVAELYALLGLAPRGANEVKATKAASCAPEVCQVIRNWAASLVSLHATQKTWSQFYASNYLAPLKKQTNGAGRVAKV